MNLQCGLVTVMRRSEDFSCLCGFSLVFLCTLQFEALD